MASVGTQVYSADYNSVQVKVRTILGDGYPYGYGTSYPDYGYGVSLLSGPVINSREYSTSTVTADISTGSYILTLTDVTGFKIGKTINANGIISYSTITYVNLSSNAVTISNSTTSVISSGSQIDAYYNSSILITKKQWQDLEDDINTINKHQSNGNFSGYGVVTGKVTVANLTALNTVINNLTLSRNTVDAAQLTLDPSIGSKTIPYAWGGIGNKGIESTANLIFNSAKEMQYFFNQGGEISFGGIASIAVTAQDIAWYNLLNNIFVNTSARFTRTEFSRTGAIPIQWYQVVDGNPPYEINSITITAQVISNILIFTVTFRDGHVPLGGNPTDIVADGAGYNVYRKKAVGAFTGIQPTATLSNFKVV